MWPGANFVIIPNSHGDDEKIFLKFGDRRKIAAELKVQRTFSVPLSRGNLGVFHVLGGRGSQCLGLSSCTSYMTLRNEMVFGLPLMSYSAS
jgi:hypothetical protein